MQINLIPYGSVLDFFSLLYRGVIGPWLILQMTQIPMKLKVSVT